MQPRDDAGSGIEWLDSGPGGTRDDPEPGQRPRGPWLRWRWWYALVALALLALVIVATRPHASKPTAAPPTSRPSSSTPSVPSVPPAVSTPLAPLTQLTVGHPVLGVSAGWELFARGPDAVVRIQFDIGKVTITSVPGLGSDGPVSFVAGPISAIVRPVDNVPGYLVSDGVPVGGLPAALDRGVTVLPGPDAGHVWIAEPISLNSPNIGLQLVGFDGTDSHERLTIPASAGVPLSDGQGYVLYFDTGGVYDVTPAGTHRITTGALIATGPTRWLTFDCDDQHRCETMVVDRASGARRPLSTSISHEGDSGVISPDGSTAAIVQPATDGRSADVRLIDLTSGADRDTGITITDDQGADPQSLVWSPDSKWVFSAANGHLVAIAADAAQPTDLGLTLPALTQVAIRPLPDRGR